MSTRTNLRPMAVISAGSMAGNLTSLPTILQSITGVSYALSWSGTAPVGTASVQVSNDYALNPTGTVANAGTWTTVELTVAGSASTTVPISGSPGTAFIEIEKTNAYAIRLIYTAGSGTGTLTAIINGKVS
jgi:hypothetical protein